MRAMQGEKKVATQIHLEDTFKVLTLSMVFSSAGLPP